MEQLSIFQQFQPEHELLDLCQPTVVKTGKREQARGRGEEKTLDNIHLAVISPTPEHYQTMLAQLIEGFANGDDQRWCSLVGLKRLKEVSQPADSPIRLLQVCEYAGWEKRYETCLQMLANGRSQLVVADLGAKLDRHTLEILNGAASLGDATLVLLMPPEALLDNG